MPKANKKGKPAQCELCGDTTHDFVMLLINPDPIRHETWCDNCFVKAVEGEQENE